MSVLQRKELEASPLADLHAIAAELGVEGFRAMRKADLIKAILSEQDPDEAEETPVEIDTDEEADQPEVLEPAPDEPEPEPEPESGGPEAVDPDPIEEEPEEDGPPSDEETATGVLDILPNGSGFVRMGGEGQSPDDVYISPAQIRRVELRAGDEVSGSA